MTKQITKHFMAFFLSLLIAVSMGLTAFAEGEGNSLTIKNTGETAHTFELYQIFTGDLSDGTLSNIQWGNGVTSEGQTVFGDAAEKASTITDAKAFADELQKYLANPTSSESVAAGSSHTFDKLSAGYYLVKDTDKSQSYSGTAEDPIIHSAYTSYIVKVVGNVTESTKLDVPTVVKKVKDTNDSNDTTSDWQDSADYDIGDDVPYQITGTMPSNIADYSTYKYDFTDTMSKGLTYSDKTATIKIGKTDVTSSFTEAVTTKEDGSTVVTWTCDNLKEIKDVTLNSDTKVVVNYTAKLNENAVIGSAGNPNTVYLTYSNNPNKGGEGETGKTPEDKNIVFTYKTVVNKFDQDKKSLAGAAFKLEKKKSDGTYTTVKEFTAGTETSFEFKGLDDGDYKLTETTTPAGYNTITPIEFTISAEHDAASADPTLISLSGNAPTGEATFTRDLAKGSLTTDVMNKKGSTLPSTGGIGTTIFYAAGGALVVLAGVMIAARKRA